MRRLCLDLIPTQHLPATSPHPRPQFPPLIFQPRLFFFFFFLQWQGTDVASYHKQGTQSWAHSKCSVRVGYCYYFFY